LWLDDVKILEKLNDVKDMNKIYLNHGCGSIRPSGWINTDSSVNANLQRVPIVGKWIAKMLNPLVKYENNNFIYANLNKKWNFRDNSVDVIYASHLFEHLSLKSAELFISEAMRTLKPGGSLRIVVPDLYKICKRYIDEYENNSFEESSTKFIMWAINMHREGQYGNVSMFKGFILDMISYPHQHKYMYDEKSLIEIFKESGFVNIRSKSYGYSDYIDCINDVEGSGESYLSIYIEAQKQIE
jgi:predicted SAM-dependent methyltransferase